MFGPFKKKSLIYIVDDEEDILEIMKYKISKDFSCNVKTFLNTNDAEESLMNEKERPELIVCDIAIPGRNGIAWRKELKEKGIQIKFIFVTGLSTSNFLDENVPVLIKPVDQLLLKNTIKKELERKSGYYF